MAAPVENLLSLGHLTGTERNTLTRQRENRVKRSVNRPMMLQTDQSTPRSRQHLRAMHLQKHWQELKDRELTAKQHNRQLLQQFEEAQDTLREMITLTAAMKTIQMEYERYLEESSPRWKQQLKEKTQAAQKKRTEDYLRSCLKSTEERVTKSSTDQPSPSPSQGATTMPQRISAPSQHHSQNSHSDYNPPHLPYMQPHWQIPPQSQAARFPIRASYQPQSSFHVLPSFLPPPHPFQPYPLNATSTNLHPRPRQDPPGWASLQPAYPWSWTVGAASGAAAGIPSGSEALWGQLYTEEPPPEMRVAQVAVEEADTSRAPSSKRERGGSSRSSHLSQELDVKPVRLSGGHAEGSESSRESSQASREKRKKGEKRGSSQRSSSDVERCSSQESSGTSSVVVIAAVTVAQSSESDDSSVKSRTSSSRRTRRSGGLAVGLPSTEKVTKERTRSKGDDSSSPSTSEELRSPVEEPRGEKVEDQSPDDKSESCGEESGSQREEESGSVSIKIEHGEEMQKQESSSSGQSSVGEKDEEEEGQEEDLGVEKDDGEEKENSWTDEEQEERGVEDDEASEGKNTTEEEDEEHEKGLGDGCDDGDAEEKESSQSDEEQEERGGVEDDDEASEGKSTSEEVQEAGAEDEDLEEKDDDEDEQSDKLKNEDVENGKKGSASSQDEEEEDESEGDEDKMEEGESDEGEAGESDEGEEGESDEGEERAGEKEEQRGDGAEPEAEEDSDDSIILPQNKSKKIHVIQEASDDDDDDDEDKGNKTGSSNESNEYSDEDDVEHLLAPQEQSQKTEEKDLKANEKPKAVCDNVMTFQVKPDKSKPDHQSDSDEFDDFYG